MRNIKKLISLSLTIAMAFSMQLSSFAGDYEKAMMFGDGNIQYFERENGTFTSAEPKGQVLSTIFIDVSDEGGGNMDIGVEMQCHVALKKATMTLYVEKENGDIVNTKSFEWLKEDYPNDDLSLTEAFYTVKVPQRGARYYIRGIFSVTSTSGVKETRTVYSSDIYIE